MDSLQIPSNPLLEHVKNRIFDGEFDIGPFGVINPYSYDVDIESYTNESRLKKIKQIYGDLFKASDINYTNIKLFTENPIVDGIGKNENRWHYHRVEELDLIVDEINKTYSKVFIPSGLFHYPPNGFCGWHTNSDYPGQRLYLVWVEEDNKSFFRYEENGEIITKWENKGWQINRFTAGKPEYWHCVGSYTNRVSIGFRELLKSEEKK